ncbi:uncharacterized protein LOC110973100 isoform X3 [Acanthaster planci]|uniref:Uncharacterized protein LOC110973100 isoform X3 n=1 Tax=Acanthaster planci TaxID=133434 RepID=A0A8B7XEX6_ACAPL|nr:uncharacterized protein LOC110973100 isoform X3 [Acanthaster planci]
MKDAKKQRTVGKSKPSQASLVSRGLAARPSLMKRNDGKSSDPPSVRSGYSLYSSDSDSTTTEVNQGLDRCAKLLANILDNSNQAGHAKYRLQKQKLKTGVKARGGNSTNLEPRPLKSGPRHPAPERKSTRTSQGKSVLSKSAKGKGAITSPTPAVSGARHGRRKASGSKRSMLSAVHVIPTGQDDLQDTPIREANRADSQPIKRRTKHVTAPGFQDHLMSSTPAERESPKKAQPAAANKTTRLPSPRQEPQPSTLSKERHGPENCVIIPSREDATALRDKAPPGSGNSQRALNAPVTKPKALLEREIIKATKKLEPDRDWMQWYKESLAQQTMHEGLGKGHSNSLLRDRNGGADQEIPSKPERDAGQGILDSRVTAHLSKQPAYQPLKDSEDLLRDLVQQLTILNQQEKGSPPQGNTEQILQDLIQSKQLASSERPANGKDTCGKTEEVINPALITDSGPPLCTDGRSAALPDFHVDSRQSSLKQLLSEFRQTPSQQTPSAIRRGDLMSTFPSHAPSFDVRKGVGNKYPSGTTNLEPTKDTQTPQPHVPGALSSQVTFLTPEKDHFGSEVDDGALNQLSTPYVHQGGHESEALQLGKYIQVGTPAAMAPTSPPRSTEPLTVEPRGQAAKQGSLQQIRMLKYLLGELQAVLADHEDIEVSRLLNEMEDVCNTLPYTTQKQLLDLNTEVLLALQPLQSENGQLRRRLRIANQQLKSREVAEREKKDESSVSLESLALQALNSNLQKQLRQERQEKEQLLKNNLQMSKTLEEKEKQHQDMLRILNDKDTNLLKTRQETLEELQDLREARSELQSKVDYLELQVEGGSKEARILQLSLDQRDKEIDRLKSFNQSLQEQVRKLMSQRGEDANSPRTLGGIGLQRMSRLLMERSPNTANKENIQSPSYHHSFSKRHPQPAQKSAISLSESQNPPVHLQNSLKKSPKQRVTFLETQDQRDEDISKWARTDTLWKDQQELPGDLIRFGANTDADDLQGNSLDALEGKPDGWMMGIKPSLEHDALGAHAADSPDMLRASPRQEAVMPSFSRDTPDRDHMYTAGNAFSQSTAFERQTLPFQSNPRTAEPAFSQEQRLEIDRNSVMPTSHKGIDSYTATWKAPTKPTLNSATSDSTVSSVTTEFEAQFQSGLRDLDAEIGKLQASLKYPTIKSL